MNLDKNNIKADENQGVTKRISILVDHFSSGKYSIFAKKAGIPVPTFQGYYNGERKPIAEHLIRIHNSYGVNLNWLLTGEGPMEAGGGQRIRFAPDPEIARVNAEIEEESRQAEIEFQAAVKLLHEYLDLIINEGNDKTQEKIIDDIKKYGDKIKEKKQPHKESLLKRIIGW